MDNELEPALPCASGRCAKNLPASFSLNTATRRGLIITSATLPRAYAPGTCNGWSGSRSASLERVLLSAIREIDESYWTGETDQRLTCRQIVDPARLMLDCDLAFPVILSSDGRVMDGMHRICKALLEGRSEIDAVRFVRHPEPDFIGADPDELPY
jgi:hypothetical protein